VRQETKGPESFVGGYKSRSGCLKRRRHLYLPKQHMVSVGTDWCTTSGSNTGDFLTDREEKRKGRKHEAAWRTWARQVFLSGREKKREKKALNIGREKR